MVGTKQVSYVFKLLYFIPLAGFRLDHPKPKTSQELFIQHTLVALNIQTKQQSKPLNQALTSSYWYLCISILLNL